uniref:Uncharacterized protein n=1 Tax=Lygus hesperus TaxID=30085 RepID=A0A146LIK9_LYGHE
MEVFIAHFPAADPSLPNSVIHEENHERSYLRLGGPHLLAGPSDGIAEFGDRNARLAFLRPIDGGRQEDERCAMEIGGGYLEIRDSDSTLSLFVLRMGRTERGFTGDAHSPTCGALLRERGSPLCLCGPSLAVRRPSPPRPRPRPRPKAPSAPGQVVFAP